MSARDYCVLWQLVGMTREPVVCYAIEGDEGLAVTVEYRGEHALAEMVTSFDAAVARADVVRRTLVAQGFTDCPS